MANTERKGNCKKRKWANAAAVSTNRRQCGRPQLGHRMLLDKDLQFGIDLEISEQDEALGAQIDTKDLLTLTTSDAFASSSLTAAEDTNDGSSFTNSNTDDNEWHEPEATDHISTITTTTTMLPTIGKAVDTTHEADSPHSPHARWQKQGEPETATAAATSNHVTYEWRISDWSECSERCGNAGGAGFGRRSIICLRLRHHTPTHNALESHVEADVETIDNAYCEDYGLSIPDTFKICGQKECAHW